MDRNDVNGRQLRRPTVRLLRQPHGFEGLVAVGIADKLDHLPASNGPNVRRPQGHWRAASLAAPLEPEQDDDALALLVEPLGSDAERVPGAEPAAVEVGEGLPAGVDPAVREATLVKRAELIRFQSVCAARVIALTSSTFACDIARPVSSDAGWAAKGRALCAARCDSLGWRPGGRPAVRGGVPG